MVREWRGGAEKVWPPREQGEEHSFQRAERDKHHHSERDEGRSAVSSEKREASTIMVRGMKDGPHQSTEQR